MKRAAVFLLCQGSFAAVIGLLFVSLDRPSLHPALYVALPITVAANLAEVRMNRRARRGVVSR